jgi:lactoylglutathione lyase
MTVNDFEAALAFYRDALGLKAVESWANDGGRGVILALPQATLELFDIPQAETVDAIEVGERVSGQFRLAVQVDNLETAVAELQQAGAAVLSRSVITPWADTNQRLKTPDGMQLTLFQREVAA